MRPYRSGARPTTTRRSSTARALAPRPLSRRAESGTGLRRILTNIVTYLCYPVDQVHARRRRDRLRQLVHVEVEGRELEGGAHLAPPEHAQVAALLRRAALRELLGELLEERAAAVRRRCVACGVFRVDGVWCLWRSLVCGVSEYARGALSRRWRMASDPTPGRPSLRPSPLRSLEPTDDWPCIRHRRDAADTGTPSPRRPRGDSDSARRHR